MMGHNATTRDSQLTDEVVARFWEVYNWMETAERILPNFASTGFLTSYGMVLLTFPFVLVVCLYMVWSMATVGPARKTLTSLLIVLFGVPLYPLLTGLVLAILWVILHFGAFALAIAGSFFTVTFLCNSLCVAASDYAEEQAEELAENPIVEDITLFEMLCGLIMGIFCLCTFGVLACGLTLVKSPILVLAVICHFIYQTLPPIFKNTGFWCPFAFLGWCFGFVAGLVVLLLAILVSALVKLVAAAIWPAYVATGWLRYFGAGGRRQGGGCCAPVVEGLKAGYQVLWAADLLTNACIYGDGKLFSRTLDEFAEIATGRRSQLSSECRKIACLPPVVVGIFQGSWDMAEQVMAKQLGVPTDTIREAWASLREQMIVVGQDGLQRGLLTQEYILEVPPELVIGFPARVLLDTIERSCNGDIVLANGLQITEENRPQYSYFANKIWDHLQDAIQARSRLQLSQPHRSLLCSTLLAGGGDPLDMPPALAQAVKDFEGLPESVKGECSTVQRHLIAVAVECSRNPSFQKELEKVIASLSGSPESGAAYQLIAGKMRRNRQTYQNLSDSSDDDLPVAVAAGLDVEQADEAFEESEEEEDGSQARGGCVLL